MPKTGGASREYFVGCAGCGKYGWVSGDSASQVMATIQRYKVCPFGDHEVEHGDLKIVLDDGNTMFRELDTGLGRV